MEQIKGSLERKNAIESESEEGDAAEAIEPTESALVKVAPDPETSPEELPKFKSPSPRVHTKSMFGSFRDFFTIEKPKVVQMRQSSITLAAHSRARSFGSDENLVSKDEYSLFSRDPVESRGIPPTPFDSMEIPRSGNQSNSQTYL